MKNLLDTAAFEEVNRRIDTLSPGTQPLWGKMNVAQMMAHCQRPLKVALGELQLKRTLLTVLFGSMIKKVILSDQPFRKGLPTDKAYMIKDQRNFNDEKQGLQQLVSRFYKMGREGVGREPHPLFGKLTADEWGTSMYKHLDHHLQQFGV